MGGADRLRQFAASSKAACAAVQAADELRSLTDVERPSVHLTTLAAFLNAHDRLPSVGDPLRERHLRGRTAILSAIHGLHRAHERLDDSPVEPRDVAATIRRWIEEQTFAPRMGTSGVQLLDAHAARYGEFDQVFLVGLIEGEWPQRSSKNIFYPSAILSQLDWPDSRTALAGERASFQDLVMLARRQVYLSTFELESDAIIGPSAFLENIDRFELRTAVRDPALARRGLEFGPEVLIHEALASDPSLPMRYRARLPNGSICVSEDPIPPAVSFTARRPPIVRRPTASARSSVICNVLSDFFPNVCSTFAKIRRTKRR